MCISKRSTVTRNGTSISCPSFVGDPSRTLMSAQPMKGILVLFAAVRSNPTLISSEITFTVVPGSVSSNVARIIIDIWVPVFQRADTSESFKRRLTVRFLPTRLTILACCVGVKWLMNAVSVDLGFSLWVSTFIAWRIHVCTCILVVRPLFWHLQEQYYTSWHWEHRW